MPSGLQSKRPVAQTTEVEPYTEEDRVRMSRRAVAYNAAIAEKAAQYVLGELSPDERDEFEALLDQSDELRAHVQELEDGDHFNDLVALAPVMLCSVFGQELGYRVEVAARGQI